MCSSNFDPLYPTFSNDMHQHSEIHKLQELSRKQDFVLLTGIPRGGTTATLRSMFKAFFGVGVNQPAMFSRDFSNIEGFRHRLNAASNRVLGEAITTKNATIIKETTHLISPIEMQFWLSICKTGFLVQRTPVLQIESLIWMILDRVTIGGLEIHEIDGREINKYIEPKKFTIDGYPLFYPIPKVNSIKSLPSHFTKWEVQMDYLRKTRDYSCLAEGFRRLSIRHPMFEDPSFFLAVCNSYLCGLGRQDYKSFKRVMSNIKVKSEDELLQRFYGIRLEDFGQLPKVLVDALFVWRLSYFPTHLHFQNHNVSNGLFIIDFTDFQLDTSGILDAVKSLLHKYNVKISDNNTVRELVQCPLGTDYSITRLDADSWRKFYGYSDFRTSFSGDGSIQKPSKTPIELDRFPVFIRNELLYAFKVYALLSLSQMAIRPSNVFEIILQSGIEEIDPVTSYAFAKREQHLNPQNKYQRYFMKKVRSASPNFAKYYEMIDIAFDKAKSC